jgi:hypothetical protein
MQIIAGHPVKTGYFEKIKNHVKRGEDKRLHDSLFVN